MSLKFLELVYDRTIDRWVWLDTRNSSIYVNNVKRPASSKLSKGFFPLTWNFLLNRKEDLLQCSYCGLFISVKEITRDHVYPKSVGGYSTAPACRPCNEAKSNMRPIEWALYAFKYKLDIR